MLVGKGAKVVLADLNPQAGLAHATALGDNARFIATDVTDEASAQAAVAQAVSAFGALHGLINCAGIAPAEKILGKKGPHGLASFARVVQINLFGSFNMLRL